MRPTKIFTFAGLAIAIAVAGCSNGQSSNLITSSVSKPKPAKVALNPACITLSSQINALRREGTPARVHKVATGKTKTAIVKRSSLAKVAQLDSLNSQFQMKCSKYPGLHTAAAPVAQPAQTAVRTATQARAAVQTAQTVKRSAIAATKPIVAVPKQ
ncbi:MAG: hypothetical protein ACI89J_001682 [Hyphomicrobiaceae bacterium]|jgi:hypothetical protein